MKKKIIALCCAICLVCTLFPLTASAAGSLRGVDYSRITSGKGYDVVLKLDNLEFHGDLSRGTTLSQSEQDRIIRQVMTDQWITEGMLTNAPRLIEEAEQMEGFSMKDVEDALLKLTGADTLIDMYDLLMGTAQDPGDAKINVTVNIGLDVLENRAEAAIKQSGKLALKGAGKFGFKLFFLIPDLTEIGLDALTKYEHLREAAALALEKKTMLDRFYDECNRRIAEASGDGGEWKISFMGRGQGVTAIHNFNMWGIDGLMSEWTLTGELVRSVFGSGDSYAGTYQGDLLLEIKGVNMANDFDKRYLDGIPLVKTALESEKAGRGIDYNDVANQPTVLQRNTIGNLSIAIETGSGTFQPSISGELNNKNDTITFTFDRIISGKAVTGVQEDCLEYTIKTDTLESYTLHQKSWMIQNLPVVGSSRYDILDNGPHIVPMPIGTVWKPLDSAPIITIYLN